MMSDRRATTHEEALATSDPQRVAELEARNGLLQYDCAVAIIMDAIERKSFKLRPSILLSLHREALQGISATAGTWRTGAVRIEKSAHQPVPAHLVAAEVENLCDYVNSNWEAASALHLSAYAMWRLNWIHPFSDGNGRTSRMVSYMVLSCKSRSILPGTPQIPDQIVSNRKPYFAALEAADQIWRDHGNIDVSEMEDLLARMLAQQLYAAHQAANAAAKS